MYVYMCICVRWRERGLLSIIFMLHSDLFFTLTKLAVELHILHLISINLVVYGELFFNIQKENKEFKVKVLNVPVSDIGGFLS